MNDRELATLILLAAFVMLALAVRDVREMLPSLAKQLFLSKITPLMLIFVAVEVVAIWLAAGFSLWSPDLLGGTILWFLLVGFVWFVSLGEAGKDPDFFKRRFLETLGVTALLEFFVNAQVMPLPIELVAQCFLLLVVGLNVVAMNHREYKPVANLTTGIMILSTLGLLTYSVTHVISDWPTLDRHGLVNELLMPVWLSGVAVSVLYPMAFYMGYELLFVRLSFLNDGRKPSMRARAGMAWGLRGSLVDIDQFRGLPAREAVQSTTAKAAYEAVRRFKSERAEDLAARAAARRNLVENAGRRGVDDDGKLLDRREFSETKEALRWLATCHMGWYRNEDQPERYRPDLLEVLRDSRQFEFETDEPIVSKVRKDGQAWFAYRATPSGHVFGIGASGPPPSQWFYDAPTPPSGFPSEASENWTDGLRGDRPEWDPEPET